MLEGKENEEYHSKSPLMLSSKECCLMWCNIFPFIRYKIRKNKEGTRLVVYVSISKPTVKKHLSFECD